MKRKVNRVGTSTLTVSLPTKWTKSCGVTAGSEVDVEAQGSSLLIRTNGSSEKKSLEADVSNLKNMLSRSVVAMYKGGFDSLQLKFNTLEEAEIIQKTIDRSCHTFETIQVDECSMSVQTLSALDPEGFQDIFRKVGFAVVKMAQELLAALTKNDEALLKSVILQDRIVDRHTDFCRRVMNKGKPIPYDRPFPVYVIAEQSEVLADVFKLLATERLDLKMKMHEDVLELLKEVVMLVEKFYFCLYNFSKKNVVVLGDLETSIRKRIREMGTMKRDDVLIISHCSMAFEVAFEMKSALLTLYADRWPV